MTISLEERLRTLEARQAYINLTARYAWWAMWAEADKLADLFSEDGIFERLVEGARQAVDGREQVRAYMRKNLAPGRITPLIHNHIANVSGDDVTAVCILQAPPTEARPQGVVALYRDRASFIDRQWLFRERRVYYLKPESEFDRTPDWPI